MSLPFTVPVTLIKNAGQPNESRQIVQCSVQPKKGFFELNAPVYEGDIVELPDPRGGVRQLYVAEVNIVGQGSELGHIEVSWGKPPLAGESQTMIGNFQHLMQAVLEQMYKISKMPGSSGRYADLNLDNIAELLKSDPDDIREALNTLNDQGLIDANFYLGGGCSARITGAGRLQVEEKQRNTSKPMAMTDDSTSLPPPYRHLESALKQFHEDAPAEKSVFVMMKFPSNDMEDWKKKCLSDLYDAVRDELDRHGLMARRADQKTYPESRQMWDNVCTHMLGCDYGVAILEDHVGDEFNPNVALEYGFMLARGSKVVLLKEANFKHTRADILATISVPFSISKEHVVDTNSVRDAISNWLSVDLKITPRRRR